MIANSSLHLELHNRALTSAREYLRCEAALVSHLQELDRARTYLYFEEPSLFSYAVRRLGLSEDVAGTLIRIARKSVQVPELKMALEEKKITVTHARQLAPILNSENKAVWIEKAAALSSRALER